MDLITVGVDTPQSHYPVKIGYDLSSLLQAEVAGAREQKRSIAVITDSNVAAVQAEYLKAAFGDAPIHVIPAGEGSKCFRELERCCEYLASKGLDRNSLLFAVGGGVTGDLAGFAAAAYFRGIEFIQVPTTLLAMVDSSVGGKTGINLSAGKNLVGAFHQPRAVYADCALLKTLPGREFSAGMAEVIKHALLADEALFEQLEKEERLSPDSSSLAAVIAENVRIKARVVGLDSMESSATDGRALLNLGHTFGHAIEAASGYGSYLHGEAVAIGLMQAFRLSVRMGSFKQDAIPSEMRIMKLLAKYQLPIVLREPIPIERLREAMMRDKKIRSGKMKFVLLNRIGLAYTHDNMEWSDIDPVWEQLLGNDKTIHSEL